MTKDEIKKELLKLKGLYSYLLKRNEEELPELQSSFVQGINHGCMIAYSTVLESLDKLLNKID